jgi:hypothetical protein
MLNCESTVMKNVLLTLFLLVMLSQSGSGQVDDIKNASKGNSSSRSSGSGSDRRGNSGGGNFFIFLDMFNLFGQWQRHVLDKRSEVPTVVGLDLMVHGAIQPSSYYVVNPRVRGTWGIFSTDFRTNYMIEETLDGTTDLMTYYWQVIQLNFINTRHAIVRGGAGLMKENFGGRGSFMEYTISTNLMFRDNAWGGFAEYRSANDYVTRAVPRREFNLQVHRKLFDAGRWHGLGTGGFQFQRYYSSVNVWGMQLGMVFKLY